MMKRTWAISFAAFYLLLSTGMYVCILHCAGEYFFKPVEIVATNNSDNSNKVRPAEHEPCSKDKNCECCKEHGEYNITENVQTGGSLWFSQIAIVNIPLAFNDLLVQYSEVKSTNWPQANAPPPGKQKIPLYISNCTILI
ncbi:hypothetical protein [Pedobacter immunditicola]|uniref:hypothetical protein n=1 Tax=Pedobacter immunditicola TaxID=3133440 RepID=UPI0030B270DB